MMRRFHLPSVVRLQRKRSWDRLANCSGCMEERALVSRSRVAESNAVSQSQGRDMFVAR